MKLSIVVPCYNEEEVFQYTVSALSKFLLMSKKEGLIAEVSELIFVDDGSKDKTWELIQNASAENSNNIKGIRLSRNKGHQAALLAGLSMAQGDFIVTIDADLQDDIHAITEMVNDAKSGAEVVFGVRKKRDTDTFFKKITAELFYKAMQIMGVDLVFNHADFRGMSKRAVQALLEYKEVNLFLRGIVPLLGYKTTIVFYDRKERVAGETKYPFKKMLSFAWQGVTSFSTIPLKMVTWIGSILSLVSLLIAIWALFSWLFIDSTIPGWTSTIIPITFFSGVQLLALGVLGEYLGKIYLEVKQRPRFFISAITSNMQAQKKEEEGEK